MIDLAPDAPPPKPGKGAPRPEPRKALPASPPRKRGLLGTVVLLGFVTTAAGGALLWQQQQDIAARLQSPPAAAAPDGRLDTLQQRLAELEQRPAPAPLAPLEHRLGVLQERLAQLEQRPAPAPDATLDERLGTVEQRLTQLEQRLTQLEQRPGPAPLAPLEERLATVEQQLAQFEQRPGPPVVAVPDVRPLEQRLAQAEQAISTGAARAARLQAISAALDAGRPLGDIQGAPPALARFSTARPPTESALRLAFPAAASAAVQASDPATAGLTLPWRMWQQVQSLVTIRQGDKIIVGTSATGVLAQAQARLDAGDLAGAVATLDQLDAAAATAIAGWREQAQALLDARAALARLARS